MMTTILLALLLVIGQDSPTRAEVATRVARDCPEVTRRALLGEYELEDVATVDQPAAEVWISGEYVRELRIVLWQEGSTTRAALAQAKGEGVCRQLARLYASDSALTQDEAIGKIEVVRSLSSSRRHPQLGNSLKQLEEVSLNARLGSSIFAPTRNVRLRITNRMESVSVTFNQAEPSIDNVTYSETGAASQPEAAAWVEELLSVLRIER